MTGGDRREDWKGWKGRKGRKGRSRWVLDDDERGRRKRNFGCLRNGCWTRRRVDVGQS